MKNQRGGFCLLIDAKDGDGGVTGWRSLCIAGFSVGHHAIVAVIHHAQVENTGIAIAKNCRIMLAIVPVGWGISIEEFEVATGSQPPQNLAAAMPIVVIDLDHPVLRAHGNDQVAVVVRV